MPPALPPFPPDRVFLLSAPEVTILRPALGLTLYLEDAGLWARQGVREVLDMFLARVPREQLSLYTTSMISEWRPLGRSALEEVQQSLSARWHEGRLRHLFAFRVADDAGAPALGLSYREVDPVREPRTGFLQLILPLATEPRVLEELARQIGQRYPFWSGVGGHLASWNELDPITSFHEVHAWCRRYLGIDVQYPDAMAWRAQGGLAGTHWLTLIGAPLAKARKIDVAALRDRRWSQPVQVTPLELGVMVRAGEAPTLGDVNQLSYPSAYAEVARALAPWLVEEPPEFPALRWAESKQTRPWFRRFLEPEGWAA